MSLKRISRNFFVFFILLFALSIYSFAITGRELIDQINKEIQEFYETSTVYYDDFSKINVGELENRIKEYEKYGYLLNPITYGTSGKTRIGPNQWNEDVNDIGENKYGESTIAFFLDCDRNKQNPDFFKFGAGWTGNKLSYSPYLVSYYEVNTDKLYGDNKSAKIKTIGKSKQYSKERLVHLGDKLEQMEAAIQAGMNEVWAGKKGKDVTKKKSQADMDVYVKDEHPSGGWLDWVLVAVPPTSISWGQAWRFNKDSAGNILITELPIAPFNMATPLDLSTVFTTTTANANPGDVVEFTADVRSNLDQERKDISYKWTITDASGNPVSGVSYGGHGTSSSGKFNTTANKAEVRQFIVRFTMPENAVNVKFEINNGENKLVETNYDNNKAEASVGLLMPEPTVRDGEVVLFYDIYSMDHQDTLAQITANMGIYCNLGINANITMTSQNQNVLGYYYYQTSDSVGAGSSITVDDYTKGPWYSSLIRRSGFNDVPESRQYLANGHYPIEVPQLGNVKATGYYFYDGDPPFSGSVVSYASRTTNLPVTAYVYNGVPLAQPYTKNEVSSTNILWTSEIIDFDVVRKMYHMDANGNRVDERNMPGQYVRHFSAQNSASVVWSAPLTQANAYANDRRTAANRGATYQNAIFATDKEFSRVDYPVKSGYMFNPLGTYKCVVNSTVYYDSSASEAEKKQAHEELVNKIINSFVYDNAMIYTSNGSDEIRFTNVTNSDKKGILNISRTDNVSINLIPHTQYQTCMEGYEESGTLNSFTDYKYREYIVSDRVSRIDAQTVLTFTVGSPIKRYTYINMPDGQYPITAKSLPFSFKGLTAPGVYLNDGITVSVRGSLYDDRG